MGYFCGQFVTGFDSRDQSFVTFGAILKKSVDSEQLVKTDLAKVGNGLTRHSIMDFDHLVTAGWQDGGDEASLCMMTVQESKDQTTKQTREMKIHGQREQLQDRTSTSVKITSKFFKGLSGNLLKQDELDRSFKNYKYSN